MGKYDPQKRRRKKWFKEKEFDFIPNKHQIMMGAFKDLAKRYTDRNAVVARMIASYNGEEI